MKELDNAIQEARYKSEYYEEEGMYQKALEYAQLTSWLKELKYFRERFDREVLRKEKDKEE